MMRTSTKTTMAAFSAMSTATATAANNKPEDLDSHRAAAFLLLQVKEMATDELVSASSKQQQQQQNNKEKHQKQKKKKTPPPPSPPPASTNKPTAKTNNDVVVTVASAVSLPGSPLLLTTTRPLPQKPQLPRSTSANFLLTPPQVAAASSSMTLTACVTTRQGQQPAGQVEGTLQGPAGPLQAQWLLPRRTVSLGSSSEDLPGLLLNAIKREQDQAKKEGDTATGAESPTRMSMSSMTSISSLSTSSSYGSTSASSSGLSLPPALVSPTADRQAVHHHSLSSASNTMLLPTIPLEEEGVVTADTTTPTAAAPCSSTTSPSSSATTTTTTVQRDAAVVVLRRKFSWKTHPVLEQYLLDHRLEYLAYSAKLNYTAEQKRYNNTLTTNLITLAADHGLVFCQEHFTFAAIRDRIRCFYKSHVQAAKKKKRKQQQQASSSNSNSNNSPVSLKRKKMKVIKTPAAAATNTTAMLLVPEDKDQVDLNMAV